MCVFISVFYGAGLLSLDFIHPDEVSPSSPVSYSYISHLALLHTGLMIQRAAFLVVLFTSRKSASIKLTVYYFEPFEPYGFINALDNKQTMNQPERTALREL